MSYQPATLSFTTVADALLWTIDNSSIVYSNAYIASMSEDLRDQGITRISGIDSDGYDSAYDYDIIIEP